MSAVQSHSLLSHLDENVLVDYFDTVHQCFLEAADVFNANVEHNFRIGAHSLGLRSPDTPLLRKMIPALMHLAAEPAAIPDLTILLMESSSTRAIRPPSPWQWYSEHHSNGLVPTLRFDGHGELIEFSNQRIYTGFRFRPNRLRLLDTCKNVGLYWVDDSEHLPYYEACAPLRKIISWWMSNHEHQFVHAAAVGTASGGVLIAGKGGCGKSTIALASLESELYYVGDDCCLLTTNPAPFAYSVYNSAKIGEANDLQRFPHLAPLVKNPNRLGHEKGYMFLHTRYSERMSKGFPVRALLIPKVTGCSEPRLKAVSPVAGLQALLPTTLSLFSGQPAKTSQRLFRLVSQVPSYVLEVGPDTSKIPSTILNLLAKL